MCVQHLASHRPAGGDVVINSHWILSDWQVEYPAMLNADPKPTQEVQEQWIAAKTSFWCKWATTGDLTRCPVANGVLLRELRVPARPQWQHGLGSDWHDLIDAPGRGRDHPMVAPETLVPEGEAAPRPQPVGTE
jgi:hypothetical protein